MRKIKTLSLVAALLAATSMLNAVYAANKKEVPQTAEGKVGKVVPHSGSSQSPTGTTIFMPLLPQPF